MIDPSEHTLREILSAPPPGPSLAAAARVIPPAALCTVVARAIQIATRLGLTLPARLVPVYVTAPGQHHGETCTDAAGVVRMLLNVEAPVGEWPRVALYELQHVADAGFDLPLDERELRAIQFSESVLRWHWPRESWRS